MQADITYLELLAKLNNLARYKENIQEERTGTGAVNIFGYQMRFNLAEEFPLLTTKKVHFKSIVTELLWFLKGDTNIKYLLENGCTIWTEWRYKAFCADEHTPRLTQEEFEHYIVTNPEFAAKWGDIGKGYGHQWRNFGEQYSEYDDDYGQVIKDGFDQISWIINEINTNPKSRRLIVSGWNPHEVDKVDLPPCHTLFQFFVQDLTEEERVQIALRDYGTEDLSFNYVPYKKLSCQLYQRSADTFLGVPFNIASYALLTHMIAQTCGLAVGEFVWTGGIVHLYANHFEQAKEQLSRSPYQAPKIKIDMSKSIFELEPEDITLWDYQHHPAIKADVAV